MDAKILANAVYDTLSF